VDGRGNDGGTGPARAPKRKAAPPPLRPPGHRTLLGGAPPPPDLKRTIAALTDKIGAAYADLTAMKYSLTRCRLRGAVGRPPPSTSVHRCRKPSEKLTPYIQCIAVPPALRCRPHDHSTDRSAQRPDESASSLGPLPPACWCTAEATRRAGTTGPSCRATCSGAPRPPPPPPPPGRTPPPPWTSTISPPPTPPPPPRTPPPPRGGGGAWVGG